MTVSGSVVEFGGLHNSCGREKMTEILGDDNVIVGTWSKHGWEFISK